MRRGALLAAGAGVAVAVALLTWPILRPAWRERRLRAVPRPLDVVLITMDTTRADKLGAFGGDRGTTPALDELARRGVAFEAAYSHVPLTLPSHASLMTGLTPARTGVHDNITFVLDAAPPTLAEIFARRGYRTGAFVSSLILERRYGLGRGFEEYDDQLADEEEGQGVLPQRRGDQTVDRALAWLETDRSKPVFLWVHLYDPHAPYEPPEPFASRFKGRRYDGEVAFMDSQIGRLLAAVAGRERPTLVAAVADHGESLGEHGEPTHGFFVYDATQRVPLILSLPGYLPSNAAVEPVVRVVDVMPTLLEIAGLPAPDGLDGRSLLPLVTGRTKASPGPAYLEAYTARFWWGAREVLGLRTGPWLFVQAPRPEIYDLLEDPAESVNLASSRPEELEKLTSQLKALSPKGDVFAQRTSVDEETAERLQALGYVAAVTHGAAGSEDLPDPKEYAPLLAKAAEAYALAAKHDYAKALEAFQEILRAAPRVVAARRETGKMLLALARYDEAYETFRQLRDESPAEVAYHIDVARARFKQGEKREALALLQESLKAFPASAGLLENEGIVLESLGRQREAEDALRRAIQAGPEERIPRLLLAKMCDKQGRVLEAAAEFEELVVRSPHARESREAGKRLAAMAVEFARAGKLEYSARAYGAALKTGAGMEEAAFLNAALVHYQLGRRGEARDILRQGARSFPASADIRYRLGRLLSEAGSPAEAEAEYRQALSLAPARNDVRFQLARLLETSGRAAEAAESYRQVASDPGSREAARAREALQRLSGRASGR